jgi:hypothetical protein
MGTASEEQVVESFSRIMGAPVAELMRRRLVAGLRKEDARVTVQVHIKPMP